MKFMETSAKVNEGVEDAFFTLARSAIMLFDQFTSSYRFPRDIKTRLIDSQAESTLTGLAAPDSVRVNQPTVQSTQSCCS